jgi:hypothetical protein
LPRRRGINPISITVSQSMTWEILQYSPTSNNNFKNNQEYIPW